MNHPSKQRMLPVLVVSTAAALCVATVHVHRRRRRSTVVALPWYREYEVSHRVVCIAFQLSWILFVSLLLCWPKHNDEAKMMVVSFRWSSSLLMGYFMYDAFMLLFYTRHVMVMYIHHALSVGLCMGAYALDDPLVRWVYVQGRYTDPPDSGVSPPDASGALSRMDQSQTHGTHRRYSMRPALNASWVLWHTTTRVPRIVAQCCGVLVLMSFYIHRISYRVPPAKKNTFSSPKKGPFIPKKV